MTRDCVIEPIAEGALLLRFGDTIDAAINARVHAAAQAIRAARLRGITDVAPAYASLLVRFDPAAWADGTRPPHDALGAAVREALQCCAVAPVPADASERCIDIPVCYGGDCGPDLEAVAAHAHLTTAEVVARHAAATYTVAMLGFAPGFPYLLGLDPALHMPRRATPRKRVPAGSVAIGGAQTGIYPRELAGGWNLIGRTPLILFDPARKPACLLSAGDTVRFHAIDVREFMRLAEPRA